MYPVFDNSQIFQCPVASGTVQRAEVRGERQHAAGNIPAHGQRLGEPLRPYLRPPQSRAQKGLPDESREIYHFVSLIDY